MMMRLWTPSPGLGYAPLTVMSTLSSALTFLLRAYLRSVYIYNIQTDFLCSSFVYNHSNSSHINFTKSLTPSLDQSPKKDVTSFMANHDYEILIHVIDEIV